MDKIIAPLFACRLIALDKNPGVRPIGIGEATRWIIAKAILHVISENVQQAAGSLQLYSGQVVGMEAAIHGMNLAFQDKGSDAVFLVDAINAFNLLNQQAALHNVRYLCPSIATVIINTYCEPTDLFVDGDSILLRREQLR